jgi:hypothetical protein
MEKIRLAHPDGKKAVSISKEKYDLLKGLIVQHLTANTATFSEIAAAVGQQLKAGEIRFDGSLNWYLEWVKLDLEAQKVIKRTKDSRHPKYLLAKL